MSRFAAAVRRLEHGLQSRGAGWLLLALFAAWYAWLYVQHPLNPGHAPPAERAGWWSWSDQYRYLQSAEALAAGRIAPDNYHYPLGYPGLAAPFVRLLPAHPFFVPDLLLVAATAAAWWKLARRWLPALAVAALGILFLATHRALIELTMVVPWNTLVTQLCFVAGLWVATAWSGRRALWTLAALAAVAWWVRPLDAVCLAPLLVFATLRLPTWRERVCDGMAGIAIIGAAVVAMGLVNRAVFGTWRTPYEQAAFTMVGFFDYPLGQKLFWTFVDARPFFGETDTELLFRYPWIFLAPAGLLFWIRREGWAGAAAVAMLLLHGLLYLGYNDFFPSSFFRFSLIHYVAWIFLPLCAAVAGAFAPGERWRTAGVGLALTGGLLILAGGLRLEPRALPASTRAGQVAALPVTRPLWVHFPSIPLEEVKSLRLDGRSLVEAADYQIPYTPSDLRLLLGDRARGERLVLPGSAVVPEVGEYHWAWRWEARRFLGAER